MCYKVFLESVLGGNALYDDVHDKNKVGPTWQKKGNSVLDEFSRKLLSRRGVIHGPLTLRDIAGPVYKSAAVKLKNQRWAINICPT